MLNCFPREIFWKVCAGNNANKHRVLGTADEATASPYIMLIELEPKLSRFMHCIVEVLGPNNVPGVEQRDWSNIELQNSAVQCTKLAYM